MLLVKNRRIEILENESRINAAINVFMYLQKLSRSHSISSLKRPRNNRAIKEKL